jgi:hypothetical protein
MLVLVLALAMVTLRYCEVEPTMAKVFGLAAAILLSRPGHWNLLNGNVSFQVALLSIIALQLARSNPSISGVALGLATFKPTFGVPIGILMLCRRDYRAVRMGFAVGAAGALVAVAVLALAAGGLGPFCDSIIRNYVIAPSHPGIGNVLQDWARIDVPAAVAHLAGSVPPTWISLSLSAACLLAAGLFLWRWSNATDGEGVGGLSGAVVLLATLACVFHLAYDAVLLFVPVVALSVAKRQPWSSCSLSTRAALIALISIPLINYLATITAMSALHIHGKARALVCASSGLAIVAALVACLWIGARTDFRRQP